MYSSSRRLGELSARRYDLLFRKDCRQSSEAENRTERLLLSSIYKTTESQRQFPRFGRFVPAVVWRAYFFAALNVCAAFLLIRISLRQAQRSLSRFVLERKALFTAIALLASRIARRRSSLLCFGERAFCCILLKAPVKIPPRILTRAGEK